MSGLPEPCQQGWQRGRNQRSPLTASRTARKARHLLARGGISRHKSGRYQLDGWMEGWRDEWMNVLRVLKLAMNLTSPHLCFYFYRGVQVHTHTHKKKTNMWTQLVEQTRNCTKTIRVERFGGYLVFVHVHLCCGKKQVNCLTYRLNVLTLNILLYLTLWLCQNFSLKF